MYKVITHVALTSFEISKEEQDKVNELDRGFGDVEGVVLPSSLTDAMTKLHDVCQAVKYHMAGEPVGDYSNYEETINHIAIAAKYLSIAMAGELLENMFVGAEIETEVTKEEYYKRFGVPAEDIQ